MDPHRSVSIGMENVCIVGASTSDLQKIPDLCNVRLQKEVRKYDFYKSSSDQAAINNYP